MKSKIIICSLMVFAFFACNKNTYKVDVEITNANGKTAYLQKIINKTAKNKFRVLKFNTLKFLWFFIFCKKLYNF